MASVFGTDVLAHEEKLLQYALKRYPVTRDRYKGMHRSKNDLSVTLMFKPMKFPPALTAKVFDLQKLMDDPLRGPVLRAAVPDFFDRATALVEALLPTGGAGDEYAVHFDYQLVREITNGLI